jgi:hypothetical protein
MPTKPITEPTDKSIPPVMITNIWPMPMMATNPKLRLSL